MNWIIANKALILGVLFGLSEALAAIPSIKANSVFELVSSWIKKEAPQPPQA